MFTSCFHGNGKSVDFHPLPQTLVQHLSFNNNNNNNNNKFISDVQYTVHVLYVVYCIWGYAQYTIPY